MSSEPPSCQPRKEPVYGGVLLRVASWQVFLHSWNPEIGSELDRLYKPVASLHEPPVAIHKVASHHLSMKRGLALIADANATADYGGTRKPPRLLPELVIVAPTAYCLLPTSYLLLPASRAGDGGALRPSLLHRCAARSAAWRAGASMAAHVVHAMYPCGRSNPRRPRGSKGGVQGGGTSRLALLPPRTHPSLVRHSPVSGSSLRRSFFSSLLLSSHPSLVRAPCC